MDLFQLALTIVALALIVVPIIAWFACAVIRTYFDVRLIYIAKATQITGFNFSEEEKAKFLKK